MVKQNHLARMNHVRRILLCTALLVFAQNLSLFSQRSHQVRIRTGHGKPAKS